MCPLCLSFLGRLARLRDKKHLLHLPGPNLPVAWPPAESSPCRPQTKIHTPARACVLGSLTPRHLPQTSEAPPQTRPCALAAAPARTPLPLHAFVHAAAPAGTPSLPRSPGQLLLTFQYSLPALVSMGNTLPVPLRSWTARAVSSQLYPSA